MNIEAQEYKVFPGTEQKIYNDMFFLAQHVVVNALDNVEARRYVDGWVASVPNLDYIESSVEAYYALHLASSSAPSGFKVKSLDTISPVVYAWHFGCMHVRIEIHTL